MKAPFKNFQAKTHVQTACEAHDSNMDFVPSKSYVRRYLCSKNRDLNMGFSIFYNDFAIRYNGIYARIIAQAYLSDYLGKLR